MGPELCPPLSGFSHFKTSDFFLSPFQKVSAIKDSFLKYKHPEKNQHQCDQIRQWTRFSGLGYPGRYAVNALSHIIDEQGILEEVSR